MCANCLRHNRELETIVPEDELWELYRAAYEQYKYEIVNGDKLYSRFVNDFISYHLPCFYSDIDAIRRHSRNVNNLYEILTERLDLVEMFFSKEHFTKTDYHTMHRLFNTTEKISTKKSTLAIFDAEELSLITQTANEAHLFVSDVSIEKMAQLFDCSLENPLKLTSNRHFARFFDALRGGGYLPFSWQKIISDYHLVISSETQHPLSANGIASALAQSKRSPDGFEAKCKLLVKKLKELQQKQ